MRSARERDERREAVEAVIAEMHRRLSAGLSLADMADIARLSPYYFLRVFRRVTGLTPRDFLAALRIEQAKRLLVTTSLSITEICFEVGYTSLGTFTARFSRMVGVSPGTFRRMGERVVEACIRPMGEPGRARTMPLLSGSGDGRGAQGAELACRGVSGRIAGSPGTPAGIVFAAAFPQAAPHGEPVACTVLPGGPGPYRIAPLPEGRFYVLACLLPWSSDVTGYLVPDANAWVGGSRGAVRVASGWPEPTVDIVLRPKRSVDPPILASSLFLLARREGFGT